MGMANQMEMIDLARHAIQAGPSVLLACAVVALWRRNQELVEFRVSEAKELQRTIGDLRILAEHIGASR